ncbi:hypothetical protein, partial [Helicobacter pylori]|uniref:hypothetical protein n=1 Tax=Helicobacter pylori TaxID=210 RepID=UPI00197AA183
RFLLVSHSHDSHVYEISPFYHKMLIFRLKFIFKKKKTILSIFYNKISYSLIYRKGILSGLKLVFKSLVTIKPF